VQTVVRTCWHHSSLCFAVEQNVWKRQISTIHPTKSTKSPLPLPTGLLTRIEAQFHHIGNSPRDIVPFSARHHNSSQPVKPVQATKPRLTSSRRTLGASQHLSAQLSWPSQQPSTRDSLKSSSIHTCTWSRKTHLQP
jgi:hypothetical protein